MSDQDIRSANARLKLQAKLQKRQAEEMQKLHQGDEQKKKDGLMASIYKEFCIFQRMQDDQLMEQKSICKDCGCDITRSLPNLSKRWNMGRTTMLMPEKIETLCSDCLALYGALQYLANRPNPEETIVIEK